jgi:hypothetical protein
MAFPSSSGSKADDLANAWGGVRSNAAHIKVYSQDLRSASAAGPIQAATIVLYADQLASAKAAFDRYTAVPGLAAYAREQVNDPALDIVAEYQTMAAQLVAVRDWIIANFPKDASGYLLYHQFDAAGKIVQRTLSSAQTAGLRTQLDALIATTD